MPTFTLSPQECGNRVLSRLSESDFNAIASHLELVDVDLQQILEQRDQPVSYVYFPCSTVLSVLAHTLDGQAVEVVTIGNEGFDGFDVLLAGNSAKATHTTQCQVAGKAFRMQASEFVRMTRNEGSLRDATMAYLVDYLCIMSQSAACERAHDVEARFARWLLMTHDRVAEDSFKLTQQAIADMVGTQRTSVALAAGAFQRAGIIRYSGGQMQIVNREALEDTSCECYKVVRKRFERQSAYSTDKQ